jgi:3-deoxy-D-manno-octulosonic-acid transferase
VDVSLAYRFVVNAAVPMVPVLSRDATSRRAHAGRLTAPGRLIGWAEQHRDTARALVWMHAASVGEGLQAREVLRELRLLRPDLQVVATRFSASAERLGESMPADFIDYLPYDRRRDIEPVLSALRPDLLVFAKLDLWPQLSTRAAAFGSRLALVAGSVDPGSARLSWPGLQAARPGYAVLDRIAANSDDDAERLVRLGASPDRITVVGDPRIDSVLRTIAPLADADGVSQAPDRGLLVAGSTWPADEAVLLEALVRVRGMGQPKARLMVVPHEPSAQRGADLERQAQEAGLSTTRWTSRAELLDASVIIVDRMGILPGLYPNGVIAYVGGGFGSRGVHSVIEPAGWGVPVIIGPNDRGLRDAELLAASGGLTRLPARESAGRLASVWAEWLADPAGMRSAGVAARKALEPDRGAAFRSAELLAGLLPDP